MKYLYCLMFFVISTAYVVEIHAERPAICREGSVNYCKDMQSAKACAKLSFCRLVWLPPPGYEIRKNGKDYEVLNPNIGFFHVGR